MPAQFWLAQDIRTTTPPAGTIKTTQPPPTGGVGDLVFQLAPIIVVALILLVIFRPRKRQSNGPMTVVAGDWPIGTRAGMVKGRYLAIRSDELYPEQIASAEVVSENNRASFVGKAGWGFVGGLALGPAGLLAGALAGGNKRDRLIAVETIDGRRALLKGQARHVDQLTAWIFGHGRGQRTANVTDLDTQRGRPKALGPSEYGSAGRRRPPPPKAAVAQEDVYEPEYEPDEPNFTDLKNEITVVAKQALAKLKTAGFEIKARPDAIIVSDGRTAHVLRSNGEILAFVEDSRLA